MTSRTRCLEVLLGLYGIACFLFGVRIVNAQEKPTGEDPVTVRGGSEQTFLRSIWTGPLPTANGGLWVSALFWEGEDAGILVGSVWDADGIGMGFVEFASGRPGISVLWYPTEFSPTGMASLWSDGFCSMFEIRRGGQRGDPGDRVEWLKLASPRFPSGFLDGGSDRGHFLQQAVAEFSRFSQEENAESDEARRRVVWINREPVEILPFLDERAEALESWFLDQVSQVDALESASKAFGQPHLK